MTSPSGIRELTVLVANDQEWTARSLESILVADGYRVIRAFTGRQALERAASTRPDAIILDAQMPDLDGVTVCQMLRADPYFGATTPIFITTAGPSGRQERLAAYRGGAWEFFGQPLDAEVVLVKLKMFLEVKLVVDGLRDESLIDEATGLYNRRGLVRRGQELAAEAARRREPLTCVVLTPTAPELDPAIETAEQLAQRLGSFFRHASRSADVIGRVGLLEFAIIAVGTNEGEAQQLVRRFNELLARSSVGDNPIGLPRVSFRAAYSAADSVAGLNIDPESMLHQAAAAVNVEAALAKAAAS